MIDLHMHTMFSDGRRTLEEILVEAENLGLTAISITDHETISANKELEKPEVRKLFSGKILPGVEITTVIDGTMVHVLGYGIDWRKIKPKMRTMSQAEVMQLLFLAIKNKIDSFGFDIDVKDKSVFDIQKDVIELIDKYPEKFPQIDLTPQNKGMTKGNVLWWQHLYNKNSILHIDINHIFSTPDEVINMIRSSGGKVILAHPAQYYGDKENVIKFMLDKQIDGIECYHYSATPEYRDYLIEFCKKNNLMITGGSDYHGSVLGALGSQNVPDELLNQFDESVFI